MGKHNYHAKPKMGILPIGKTNQYQGNIWKYVEVAKSTFGQDPDMEIMIPDEPLFDYDDVQKAAIAMEKADCDMFLFVIGSWM